jgi:hypothetical protein
MAGDGPGKRLRQGCRRLSRRAERGDQSRRLTEQTDRSGLALRELLSLVQ